MDGSGNEQNCALLVTVEDKIFPTISCPEDITRTFDIGETFAIISYDIDYQDNCESALYTNSSLGSGSQFPLGTTFLSYEVIDDSGNSASCSFNVTVTKRLSAIEYTGDISEQYSDQTTVSALLKDELTGNPIVGETLLFSIGSQSTNAITDTNGYAESTIIIDQTPGDYEVSVVYAGNDYYKSSSTKEDFEIEVEDAIIEYTGLMLQATAPKKTTATVDLTFNVQDISCSDASDTDPGDIRNAIVDVYVEGSLVETFTTIVLVDPNDTKTGSVSVPYTFDIGNLSSDSYTVRAEIRGYYTGSEETVITVYEPVGDFITGGGYIKPDNSAGQYASTDGWKTNFGFNVGYNKKGNKLKGHMNIIFRRMEADGLHKYQVKGNAIQSLGVDISDADAKIAQFITKANLTDITDPQNTISLGGNLILKVDMTDRGEPGTDDSIAINLTDGGVLVYSSNWTGISTDEMVLAAGNLLVHSGYSKRVAETTDFGTDTFELRSWPNPSSEQFYLRLDSANTVDVIEINVFDVSGKQVYRKTGNANEEYHFGSNLDAGLYFVNVTQAGRTQQVKLVKY